MEQIKDPPINHERPFKPSTDVFMEAYAAFKHAKAQWDQALYAPGMLYNDLPQDEDDRLCGAACSARQRLMETPAPSLATFIWKLRVFQQEDLHEADMAGEFVNHLVNDAERLLREDRRG